MRLSFLGLVTTGMLASHLAQSCTRPADKTAFDVAGLKSHLMVTAITCEASERYNMFIMRHRRDLVAQERVLTAYFSRNFGKQATAQHDDYVTSLANTQSQDGLKAGNAFCGQNLGMFDEVMKLHGAAELTDYATGKAPVQPIDLVACAASGRTTVHTALANQTKPR